MKDFTFQNTTKIIFGKHAIERVGEETAACGKKVLLHYGGGHIKKTGLYEKIIDALKKAGRRLGRAGRRDAQPTPVARV